MSLFRAFQTPSAPTVAVEIGSRSVSAAALDVRAGNPAVAAYASEALPEGALVPSMTGANILDRDAVIGACERLVARLGVRPRRIGLVVPDVIAKVSFARFAHVPARADEFDQLVRWQVRKTAPFPIEEAQVSYAPGVRAEDGQEFIVTLAHRSVVQEYEQICTQLGAHAGIVDLSTVSMINAALAAGAPAGDWLLVRVAPAYASIAIIRGPDLIFFRNRATDADGTLADLVHQTTMYYEDRLTGTGFTRVVLSCGAPPAEASAIRLDLADRLRTAVEHLDPRRAAALTDRIDAGPEVLDRLAPLIGILLRDRVEARAV